MGTLRGFGFTFDVDKGFCRNWYVDESGDRRWCDNGRLLDDPDEPIPYRLTEAGKGEQ